MIFGQEVLIFPPFIAGERDFSAIHLEVSLFQTVP